MSQNLKTPRTAAQPARSTGAIAALAGYLGLTLILTYPLIVQFASAIPGDSFDGWQNYWNLWWVRVALLEGGTHPFFTPILFHPTGVSLLFHTLNPFNGLLTLPVQLIWGLIPAYNSVVLFSFVMGGLGAFLLARSVLGPGGRWLPAFLAGAVFTFSPFHIAHLLGHMQVISLEWIPFYGLYLFRLARRATDAPTGPMRRDAGMAALFLILVGLCDWYYVLYCLLLTGVVFAWALWRLWRRRETGDAGRRATQLTVALGAAWLAFALILSPLLIPMVREASQFSFMVPDPEQSRILSADLLAFVTPQEFHPLWGEWARERAVVFTSTVSEHQVFIGFTVLALALAGFIAARRSRLSYGPWGWVLIAFFVLSLGPVLHIAGQTQLLPGGGELPLPYTALARAIPFMEITRSVSRLDVIVMLATAVLAAVGLQWLMSLTRRSWLIGVAALGLVLFEFLPAPYPMSPPDTPAWYTELAQEPGNAAVLNLPMNWDRPGYLLYQTVHGKPLTVAYISRNDPRTLTERAPVLQHFRHLGPDIVQFDLAAQGLQVLSDLGVGWVVLDRYKMPGGEERSYTEAAAEQIFAGREPVYRDERITVYVVNAAEKAAPYIVLGKGWGAFEEAARTRVVDTQAELIVRSPEVGQATLRVTVAPDGGALDLPGGPEVYALPLALQPGENRISLRTLEPGVPVIVKELALTP